MERPTIPTVSTSVTLDELRSLTMAQHRYSKPITQLFEDAVNFWSGYIDHYGDYEPPALPVSSRVGVQVVVSSEALEAIDRIRASRYSRAVALYAAIHLWLDREQQEGAAS